jgi:HPr kinase/phosphorylase
MTSGQGGDAHPSEPTAEEDDATCLHASTVAMNGRAVLIRGASGSGKSGLALQLIALGADLVADDRTLIRRDGAQVSADAPRAIRGRIEARGMGLLNCPAKGPAHVVLIVDMDREEEARLPPPRREDLLGVSLPVTRKNTCAHFPAAIMTYLRHGRSD